MASNDKLVRVAVFIDGGYFDEVSRYYKFGHERGSRLSLEGTNAFIRRITAEKEHVEEDRVQVTESHYFRGRFSASDAEAAGKLRDQAAFDDILIRSNIRQHYLPVSTSGHGPPKERGIEVALALEAYERAVHGCYDVLALIGCDRDYVPLLGKLTAVGVPTLLLAWDFNYEFEDYHGRTRQKETRTAHALIDAATYPVMMTEAIEDRVDDGKLIDRMFV